MLVLPVLVQKGGKEGESRRGSAAGFQVEMRSLIEALVYHRQRPPDALEDESEGPADPREGLVGLRSSLGADTGRS